jgi:hypothetical protein
MLLDGNIQNFSYYFVADFTSLSSQESKIKIFNILTIFVGFLFFFTIFSLYFLIKLLSNSNKSHSKYLLDNSNISLGGCAYLMVWNILRNFFVGAIHELGSMNP